MDQLKIEHYKSIMQENQYCLAQIQQLWLFKLTTLGVVLVVGVLSDKLTAIGSIDKTTIIAISLLSLPIVSFIIDIKILEFSLHLKAISKHLIQHFAEEIEIHSWEEKLWTKNLLTKQRTFLTIFSSIGLSVSILIISFYFVFLLQSTWLTPLLFFGIISIIFLLLVSVFIIPKLLN